MNAPHILEGAAHVLGTEQFPRGDTSPAFFVMPQPGMDSLGRTTPWTDGRTIPALSMPNRYDKLGLLLDCEKGVVPGMSVTVTSGG